MGEDMTYAEVDWVAVMFHAAKQIGAENRRLRVVVQQWEQSRKEDLAERNEIYLLLQPIKEMYDKHPYANARSLERVIGEMVELWEEANIPF